MRNTKIVNSNELKKVNSNRNMNKKELGQFYTVEAEYILGGIRKPPEGETIVEPFAGDGDLIKWIGEGGERKIEAYDIEPRGSNVKRRDTLRNPPNYDGKWVVTNPPFLARNKTKEKEIFDKYEMNDLYKCAIRSITESECKGGILIVPAGFFFSERKGDCKCRDELMKKYEVKCIKYFEERVFPDTATTIVAFSFIKGRKEMKSQEVEWICMPRGEKKKFIMSETNRWIVGGEILRKAKNGKKVKRYVVENAKSLEEEGWKKTSMLLCALDSGKSDGRISLRYKNGYVYEGKESSRTYATIMVKEEIPEKKQEEICEKFNKYIEEQRGKYWSLFLPQFRESKEYARKRIPFELAYGIIGEIIGRASQKMGETETT